MERSRPQTFDQALQVINEAIQTQGAGLKDLLNADYSNLRVAIEDFAPRATAEFKNATAPYVNAVDKQVRENPYLVLGGVALGALALGYLFGRNKAPQIADYSGLTYGDVQPADNVELA